MAMAPISPPHAMGSNRTRTIMLQVLGATLLGVYGIWQRQGEIRHLVAKRLVDMSHLLGRLESSSRNFC